jgi:excisionase family DNA binding protein
MSQPFNIIAKLENIDGLLTVDEVAGMFGLSKFTIYRMAQKRQIPCLMLGGTRKFDPSTLIVWLCKKEPQPAVAARQLKLIA